MASVAPDAPLASQGGDLRRWAGLAAGLGAALVVRQPIPSCLLLAAGVMGWKGMPLTELARVGAGTLAVLAHRRELGLASLGLALVRRGPRGLLDGPSLGWGALVAAHAASEGASPSWITCGLMGMAALLLGSFWPFCTSWLAPDEGWGRRLARTIVALHLLGTAVPHVDPVTFEAWAPLVLFLPGLGAVWAGILALSPHGQGAALQVLWFFEVQLLGVVLLATRSLGGEALGLFVWAAVLPVLVLLASLIPRAGSALGRRGAELVSTAAFASILGVPGTAGFAARFCALSRLVASSPAGLACYVAGLLVVPALIRPLRDQSRETSASIADLAVSTALVAMVVILGLGPALGGGLGQGLWRCAAQP